MKIIYNHDLYVQKEDLIYLYNNNNNFYMPFYLQALLKDAIVNGKDFVKVTDNNSIEYVYISNIPSFDELIRLKPKELLSRIHALELDYEDTLRIEEFLSVGEIINEKRNKEYFMNQYREIMRFHAEASKLEYPDVPYPYMISVTNGKYNAQVTYNMDRIVIYNADGTKATDVDDYDFIDHSFKELTHNFKKEEDIDLDMEFNGDYFIVKNKQKCVKRRLTRP